MKFLQRLSDNAEGNSELVIGLVGAVGTDLDNVITTIKDRLSAFRYNTDEIRISKDIISLLRDTNSSSSYERIEALMTEGNYLRKLSEDNAILSRIAAATIFSKRKTMEGGDEWEKEPSSRKAYIISSLKHPEEVKMLREIYTSGFFLIGVYADEKRRKEFLINNKTMEEFQAEKLIERDSEELHSYGQHTRDTYELSDFFINYTGNIDRVNKDLWRVLDLIFGSPYITPTFDEYAMFMAFSASLRSADLSRQVGAVLTKNKNIISTGANDVPSYGGGLYWPDYENDIIQDVENGRDYKRGSDSNVIERKEIIDDIIQNFDPEKAEELRKALEGSKIKYITEYGRVVHAEMEALLSCARSHTSAQNGVLYCTTFPCHNCAKHIVASGIKRVVYVEPYPKSKAFDFHPDSISTPSLLCDDKVIFEPFVGVGPRCFFNLFSINLGIGYKVKRKDKDGKVIEWDRKNGKLRMQMLPSSYLEREAISVSIVEKLTERLQSE